MTTQMIKSNPRTCVLSRIKYERHQLLRLFVKDRTLNIDWLQSSGSRGFYIYPNMDNLQQLLKNKTIKRITKNKPLDNIETFYDSISEIIKGCDINAKKTNKK